jgi:hypothetical protein
MTGSARCGVSEMTRCRRPRRALLQPLAVNREARASWPIQSTSNSCNKASMPGMCGRAKETSLRWTLIAESEAATGRSSFTQGAASDERANSRPKDEREQRGSKRS